MAPKKNTKSYSPKTAKRFIPEEASRFVTPGGKLLTNRETRDFLFDYDIEPDNGRMVRFSAGSELSRLASDFHAMFSFSPKHVLHPFDLRFFEPRGHPLAPRKRAQYARKKQEQPLWIIVTSSAAASSVVRTLTQRRLTRSVYKALGELGYRARSGSGGAEKVRGTLWVALYNPLKAAGESPKRFGRVVADALVAHCRRQPR